MAIFEALKGPDDKHLTDEQLRLESLQRYAALNSFEADAFNDVAMLVSTVFHVPCVLVTIVNEDTVFLKANIGVPATVTSVPKEMTLSRFTVENKATTVFQDTTAEACLSNHPLLLLPRPVLFYAGAPIITSDGFCIGSLCIADYTVREFSAENKKQLEQFAAYIMKQMEERTQLQQQREFAKFVQTARRDAVWDWHLDTDELIWNEGVRTLFGWAPGSYKNGFNQWLQKVHPDDAERLQANTSKTKLGEQEEWVEEYRVLTTAGDYVHVLDRGRVLLDSHGVPYRMVGSMIDISDQVRIRQNLQKQNEITQTITDNATVALFMMDKEGYCTFMNPAAEKMTGYSFDEIRQKPLHYMIHHHRTDGTFYPKEECPIDRALPENFNVRAHEDVFIRKDGTFFPVSCAAGPLFEKGQPIATVVEVRDLTEQKRSEQLVLQKTESLALLNDIGKSLSQQLDLQNILQQVTDITTKLSNAQFGAFFYNTVNDEGEAFMLYTLSGAPREAFSKFPMPRNTDVFHATFSGESIVRSDDIKQDPRYGKMSPHFGMPKGHLPVTSYLAVPVFGGDNEVIGGLFFGHADKGVFTKEHEDLVAGVAAQAAIAIQNSTLFRHLQEANQKNETLLMMAHDLNEKKDEFLSIASHELKTPLTSIRGYNQLMNVNPQPQFVAKQMEAIAKLERLINDLLDVTKINAGHLQYNKEVFDVRSCIQRSAENINRFSPGHNIHTAIPEEELLVYADKVRIEQVVDNILSNAVKYSPKLSTVQVSLVKEKHMALLTVRDQGPGIAEEHLEKIFDRFYRIDAKTKEAGGLGLGLFISMQIIREHNGTIWVESRSGEGAAFHISLPLFGADTNNNAIHAPDHYEDDSINIRFDANDRILSAEWKGVQDYQTVSKGGALILEYIQSTGAEKILNDNSLVIGNWSAASEEGKDLWFPALAAAGVKYFAWVQSEQIFSQLSASKSIPDQIAGIDILFCKNYLEAKQWLNSR